MLTPAMTASSVSPPDLITSIAFAHARTPLALATAMFLGRDCPLTIRIIGNAAAPSRAARRLTREERDIPVIVLQLWLSLSNRRVFIVAQNIVFRGLPF